MSIFIHEIIKNRKTDILMFVASRDCPQQTILGCCDVP